MYKPMYPYEILLKKPVTEVIKILRRNISIHFVVMGNTFFSRKSINEDPALSLLLFGRELATPSELEGHNSIQFNRFIR